MSTREQFEKWFEEKYPNLHRAAIGRGSWSSEQRESASRKRRDLFDLWQASRAAALEEAAKVSYDIAVDRWNLYKGHAPYSGSEPNRADPYTEGQSDGAEMCADAIRALAKAEGD